MVAAVVDTLIVAVGGILTALIGGGFAFAGVVYNARAQQQPAQLTIDAGELAELRATIVRLEARLGELRDDRDYWRTTAEQWMPHRRRHDQPD